MRMDKKQVYVVTSGGYDEYHIVGIFSTMDEAEFINNITRDANAVEAFTLDNVSPILRKGYKCFTVFFEDNGDSCVYDADPVGIMGNKVELMGIVERLRFWRFTILAKDKKHAVKIANEYRVRMIADGTWELRTQKELTFEDTGDENG
jgi:hypothetical protein